MRPQEPTGQTQTKPDENATKRLAEELEAAGVLSEGLAEQIAENWSRIVVAFVGCVALVFLVGKFRTDSALRHEAAAGRFTSAQEAFEKLHRIGNPEDVAAKSDGETTPPALEPTVEILTKGSPGDIYSKFGELYLAVHDFLGGNSEKARARLKPYNVNIFAPVTEAQPVEKGSSVKLVDELAALLYARTFLADGENLEEGRTRLKQIVRGGKVTNTEALIALFRTSSGDEQLAETKALAEELTKARPELSNQVRTELSRFGVTL